MVLNLTAHSTHGRMRLLQCVSFVGEESMMVRTNIYFVKSKSNSKDKAMNTMRFSKCFMVQD